MPGDNIIGNKYWRHRNPEKDSTLENIMEYLPGIGIIASVNDWMNSVENLYNKPNTKNLKKATLESLGMVPFGKVLGTLGKGTKLTSKLKRAGWGLEGGINAMSDDNIYANGGTASILNQSNIEVDNNPTLEAPKLGYAPENNSPFKSQSPIQTGGAGMLTKGLDLTEKKPFNSSGVFSNNYVGMIGAAGSGIANTFNNVNQAKTSNDKTNAGVKGGVDTVMNVVDTAFPIVGMVEGLGKIAPTISNATNPKTTVYDKNTGKSYSYQTGKNGDVAAAWSAVGSPRDNVTNAIGSFAGTKENYGMNDVAMGIADLFTPFLSEGVRNKKAREAASMANIDYLNPKEVDRTMSYSWGGNIYPGGGNTKPDNTLYVNNPNDPRLKAYNDSLQLYNLSNYIQNTPLDWGTQAINKLKNLHNINSKIKPIGKADTKITTKDASGNIINMGWKVDKYKKPVQSVELKKSEPKMVNPTLEEDIKPRMVQPTMEQDVKPKYWEDEYTNYGNPNIGKGRIKYGNGEVKEYGNGGSTNKNKKLKDNDSLLEDFVELVDPTGISSYDDVYRSYKNTGLSTETALETLGALPVVGKFGKTIKGLKMGSNLFKEYKLSKLLRAADKFSDIRQVTEIMDKSVYSNGGKVGIYNMPKGLTHEQHPWGGYPITNNDFVEEGEVVLDKPDGSKYIFSNRLNYK